MPALETIYETATYETEQQLLDWMIKANAYGFVTRTQGKSIVQELTPMLPVDVSLAVRTPKSTIYITADGKQFRVGQRGQVEHRGWNPNPRRYVNPWL